MSWIEVHQSIWDHWKTLMLTRLLGVDHPEYAVSYVCRLWHWALDSAPNGDLSKFPDWMIAIAAGWDPRGFSDRRGKPVDSYPTAEAFVAALIECRWLDPDKKLHNWNRYSGKLVKQRRAKARKMREFRLRRSLESK